MPKSPFSPLNVFHKLEVGSSFLNLLNGARGEFVGKFAQHNTILEDVLVSSIGEGLTDNVLDPGQDLLFLLLVSGL